MERWTVGLVIVGDPLKMEVLPLQWARVNCVPFVCSAERPEILVRSSGQVNSWSYRCPPAMGIGESVLAGLEEG